jgi:hypothetical protein
LFFTDICVSCVVSADQWDPHEFFAKGGAGVIKFMSWLWRELEGIKVEEIKPPDQELAEQEEVLEILTGLDLRRVYTLWHRLECQAADLTRARDGWQIRLGKKEDDPDHDVGTCALCSVNRRLTAIGNKKRAVEALFWAGLQHELPDRAFLVLQAKGDVIGIRAGWQVVACSQPTSSLLPETITLAPVNIKPF